LRLSAFTVFFTLSLHDALPISRLRGQKLPAIGRESSSIGECFLRKLRVDCMIFAEIRASSKVCTWGLCVIDAPEGAHSLESGLLDRKSTRLNSSHVKISYAVFC